MKKLVAAALCVLSPSLVFAGTSLENCTIEGKVLSLQKKQIVQTVLRSEIGTSAGDALAKLQIDANGAELQVKASTAGDQLTIQTQLIDKKNQTVEAASSTEVRAADLAGVSARVTLVNPNAEKIVRENAAANGKLSRSLFRETKASLVLSEAVIVCVVKK